MAEEALKKLEEQLNCSICLDTYTDPKLLQCFHVYCQQCLVKLVVRDQQGQLSLTCPTCRQVTPIPDRGVAGLQSAFHIHHLLDIQESFHKVQNSPNTLEAAGTNVPNCLQHIGEELKLYCETCGELVCLQCVVKGGKHHHHDYDDLGEAFKTYKEEITVSLEPMEKQVTTIKKALAQLDTRCGEISNQRAATKDNIHATFRKLQEILNVRETELVGQLDQLTHAMLKDLAVQRDQIETTLAQLGSCLHFMRESLRTGNDREVLTVKTNTVKQIKELSAPFQQDVLKPSTEANVVFHAPAGITAVCQNYGLVSAPSDPLKCHTKVRELASEATALAQSQHVVCRGPIIIDNQQGQLSSAAKSTTEKLVPPTLCIDKVLGPCGVAINHKKEEVVVTEWNGQRISVFSLSGEKLRSFGEGQFRGVAVDGEGNILLTDYWNNCIQKFTAEGYFLTAVGSKGFGPLQFSYPVGIAFNATNSKVYVIDWANHRIQILNSDLTFFGTFGKEGNGKKQFSYPCGIAFDRVGKVYVADSGNHRIQVFTAKGEFLTMFGCYEGMEELNYPNCLAIDASGKVYVGEGDNYRVSVFTSEGHLVTSFGRRGEEPGEFNWPCGLAEASGAMYVCDYSNDRIQVIS